MSGEAGKVRCLSCTLKIVGVCVCPDGPGKSSGNADDDVSIGPSISSYLEI